MRIGLSVDTGSEVADLIVDADDQSTVGDLVAALPAAGLPGGQLNTADTALTPETRLADARLHDGDILGLDRPAPYWPRPVTSGLQLHVVSGPISGAVYALPVGEHEIGRGATIALADGALSRRHCLLTVAPDGVTVSDLGSSNGTRVDGVRVAEGEATPLPVGATLDVGHSVLQVKPADQPVAETEQAEPGHLHFLRPPRLLPHPVVAQISVPRPPPERRRSRFPLIAMLLPLAFAGLMIGLTHNVTYVAFALMSPMMLLGNFLTDRRGSGKDHAEAVATYDADLAASQRALDRAVVEEQHRTRDAFPDAAATYLTCVLPGRRLWERRPHDPDSLVLRVGTADLPASVRIDTAGVGLPTGDEQPRLHAVPVTVALREAGVVGIAGRQGVTELVRWLLVQLCAFHPTRDLDVTLIAPRAEEHWRWVRWLPHVRPEDTDAATAFVGNDPDTVSAQIAYLTSLMTARKAAAADMGTGRAALFPAHVLIVHGYRAVRTTLGLQQLLDDGPSVGIYAICTDEDERLLPEACTATIVADPTKPDYGTLRRSGEAPVAGALLEGVTDAWCERVARAISPLLDVGGDVDEAMLPESARLLDVIGADPPEPEAIRAKWTLEPRSTTMTIGVGLDGPFALDLRRDGPHGLIAGTTGSGKTELLQTMIASLAYANRPDELNFVLVDYKGDSAFKDCVNLPHTVGKVNDLDPHLVERALESLSAELRYREHFLAQAQVKDIEDYQLLLVKEPHRPPLPRLLLIIDEFASMIKELPDFVTGLVSIAQRGRSLGIHLLLATQRPSGVVSAEIRANTNLRISLRVTDAADSSDILNAPDAARIPKSAPGRGFARLGAGSLLSFQAGRVGGRRPGAVTTGTRAPFVARVGWRQLGYQAPQVPEAQRHEDVADTDLAAMVAAIRAAAATEGIAEQRSPWLPPLEEQLTLAGVREQYGAAEVPAVPGGVPALPFGLSDLPSLQQRRIATFDLDRDGHLYFVGSSKSGRSQALRTIAGSVAELADPSDIHLYGLDCGSGALNPMTALPHCGAVVSRTEPERAGRLLAKLAEEVNDRQRRLAARGYADIREQRASDPDPMPHIVVMIDRWEGFVPTLGEIDPLPDLVLKMLREGASVGVHLVITGDRSLLTNSRMSTATENKYAMKLADMSDVSFLGLSAKQLPDHIPPGRAFGPGGVETQVMLLEGDASGQGQAAALQERGRRAHARVHAGTMRPFRVDVLPTRISYQEAMEHRPEAASDPFLLVGVGGDELTAFAPDLSRSTSFIVAGPGRSGRSTVLAGAVRSLVDTGATVVAVAPRPSPLRDLGHLPGVAAVFKDASATSGQLADLADSADGAFVVVIDDAEGMRDCDAAPFYLEVVKGQREGAFLVIGGDADGVGVGLSGWQVEAKKSRQGLLLSPQGLEAGTLVGARVPRSVLGQPVQPGRGWLHLGDGELRQVATVADA